MQRKRCWEYYEVLFYWDVWLWDVLMRKIIINQMKNRPG